MEYSYRVYDVSKFDPDGDKYGLFLVSRRSDKDAWHRPEMAELYGDDLDAMRAEVEMMLAALDEDVVVEE